MARVVVSHDVGAVLQQLSIVKISNVFASGATLFDFVVILWQQMTHLVEVRCLWFLCYYGRPM